MVVHLFFPDSQACGKLQRRMLTQSQQGDHPLPRGLPEKLVFTVHGVSHLVP